jgi:N-acyl-D-amino-acid deacylase
MGNERRKCGDLGISLERMTFDLKIAGGELLDGSGAPAIRADVGICGDRIADVGDLSAAEARQVVDAAGCFVCPGFIDVHSHSDAYVFVEPSAPSKIFQGVTTEIVGNCGASAAPKTGAYLLPSDWRAQSYPRDWSSVAEYRALFDEVRPAVNVALLIGHNTLRAGVMGYEARAARADEVAAMAKLLDQALEEGGAGLSTGLVYTPGMFARTAEIESLAAVAARRGGIYTSHMRSEGKRLLEAIDETIDIGRATGIRVQVSHLKTSGRANWGLLDGALDGIRRAREDGIEVASDRYPYTASCTDLDVILPDWASGGGRDEVLARLADAECRKRLRGELLAARDRAYWDGVMIGSTWSPANLRFKGMKLTGVAKELAVEAVDAALHLMETDGLRTTAIFFGMSEENMWRILAEPYVMIGSDGSLRAPTGPLSADHPHPRAYGTFPLFLRAALDGKTVSLAEAVRKMTSLPASQFRLKDRGLVRKGLLADLVAFRAGTLRDTATYTDPHRLAEGIEAVVVNGTLTLQNGRFSAHRAGRFLAPSS